MPTFGKLDEYNETEDWRHYMEHEIIDPDKRRSIFLVCVGAETYKLVGSLVAPEDPKDNSYEDLAKILQDHFMRNLRLLFSDSSLTHALNNQVRRLFFF